MKTILFSGLAASALLFGASTAGASDSWADGSRATASEAMDLVANGRKPGGMMPKPGMGMHKPGGFKPGMPHIGGPRPGFHGIPRTDIYRRPYRGFVMPRYWVQPSFYIPNYTIYGLSAPSRGYNWSRYYDDAVLMDGRGYVQDYRSGVDWNAGYAPQGGYNQAEYGPAMRADAQAYDWNDNGSVSFAAPDGSSYSYDGEWNGEYVDPQGRVFEGEWEGTVTRHDGVAGPGHPAPPRQMGAPYPHDDGYGLGDERRPPTTAYGLGDERGYSDNYTVPRGYEGYERCLKSNGLKGGVIGAIIGGVAGNRIAGRGDRLGGSLLGAGLGGLAGVAVEKATNKCKKHVPHYEEHARPYPPQGYPQQSHGWQGGYYYYPQAAPTVTVITMAPVTTTTTTVTEEVYYETVRSAPRKKAVRKWKAKPKPRCTCR